MNRDHQFEKRLQRQPVREVPAAWRNEILLAARKAVVVGPAPRRASGTWFTVFVRQVSFLLSPRPRAWAGLAAVWLVILTMNFASREGAATLAERRVSPPARHMREMLREQRQLLAELFDQPGAVDRTRAIQPRPHSFYRNEFLNA